MIGPTNSAITATLFQFDRCTTSRDGPTASRPWRRNHAASAEAALCLPRLVAAPAQQAPGTSPIAGADAHEIPSAYACPGTKAASAAPGINHLVILRVACFNLKAGAASFAAMASGSAPAASNYPAQCAMSGTEPMSRATPWARIARSSPTENKVSSIVLPPVSTRPKRAPTLPSFVGSCLDRTSGHLQRRPFPVVLRIRTKFPSRPDRRLGPRCGRGSSAPVDIPGTGEAT